jgi:hypothetical protein
MSVEPNRQNFGMLTVPVRTIRTGHMSVRTMMWQVHTGDVVVPEDDTWQVCMTTRGRFRTGHVAAPEGDMCQADLAFLACSWTNPEVKRVTSERVTHCRVMSADDMVGLCGMMTGLYGSDVALTWQC